MSGNLETAVQLFTKAREHVASAGKLGEVEWQRTRNPQAFTESDLLRESAWVILCSGFREAIVRRVFDKVSLSFCDWESAAVILGSARECRAGALASIRNTRKIDAILGVAQRVDEQGFFRLKKRILQDPILELQEFRFIGPVTSWHLAKNLGFDCAKPDRHLARIALALGFSDVHQLCKCIASAVEETVSVVDIILWRYSADLLNL